MKQTRFTAKSSSGSKNPIDNREFVCATKGNSFICIAVPEKFNRNAETAKPRETSRFETANSKKTFQAPCNTHVIKSLPYTIEKPGYYCLSRSFIWTDNTRSAITIKDTDNVHLNFESSKLSINSPGEIPVVGVDSCQNVTIIGISIEAVGSAVFASSGLSITNSEGVNIIGGDLLNITGVDFVDRFSLKVENCEDLRIECLSVTNNFDDYVAAENIFRADVMIKNCIHVTLDNCVFEQAQLQTYQVENLDITGLKSDVSKIVSGGCIIIVSRRGTDIPLRQTRNIKIKDCHLKSSELFSAGAGIYVRGDRRNEYPSVQNAVIESNTIIAPTGIAIWLDEYVTGFLVKNNSMILGDSLVESDPVFDFADGMDIANCSRGTIDGNKISAVDSNVATSGILLFGGDDTGTIPPAVTEHLTIINNSISGCSYLGYSDNLFDFFPDASFGCVFKDNVAAGNLVNYNLLVPSTISIDNVDQP